MAFTLGTAAQATGTAKSTILRAIRAGRITASRDDIGQYVIDPAELARVFPLLAVPGAPPPQPRTEHDAMADVLVAELRATIADLRSDRDHWRQMAERLSLPPPPPATPDATVIEQGAIPAAPPEAPPKRRWWRRAG